MSKYFLDNNLITSKQSGFRPGDSCINHLLSLTHDTFTSFDNDVEVSGVFLDISKAFDKVWLDKLIYKLKQNGIKDKLLCLLIDFLKNRQQRVVLNGKPSSWTKVNAGVPQGSILGHLLFSTCLTVYSLIRNFLLTTVLYFLPKKISPQALSV